jgi:hypothetical protein
MKFPFCKCPFCECDLLLEAKIFSPEDKDLLPKTRYLQAYVKYLKIVKLAKEYEGRLWNSGRIRDLLKDCLNDMEMALELKFGKRYRKYWKLCSKKQQLNGSWKTRWYSVRAPSNRFWNPWMVELAYIRNQAIHKMTIFKIEAGTGIGYLRAEYPNGEITEITETPEQALPYLEKTLEKIKEKLEITEI